MSSIAPSSWDFREVKNLGEFSAETANALYTDFYLVAVVSQNPRTHSITKKMFMDMEKTVSPLRSTPGVHFCVIYVDSESIDKFANENDTLGAEEYGLYTEAGIPAFCIFFGGTPLENVEKKWFSADFREEFFDWFKDNIMPRFVYDSHVLITSLQLRKNILLIAMLA